jgi:hypothetical protein
VPKNEDGEFELILGNRQLLSVFFIVVILLGVFFTMGYIVGRNSTPLGGDVAATRNSKPLVVEPPPQSAPSAPDTSSAPPPSTPAPTGTAAQQPAPEQPPPSTPEPTRTEPQRAEPVRAAPAKAEPVKAAKAAPPPATLSSEPAPGQSYLQLAATSKREADIMVDVLRQKGFKAMAAEIPEKHGTFRVLVGPVTDGTANKTRADLQSGGFPGNAAIRRTF